jgi:hypothetical protein
MVLFLNMVVAMAVIQRDWIGTLHVMNKANIITHNVMTQHGTVGIVNTAAVPTVELTHYVIHAMRAPTVRETIVASAQDML